MLSQHTTKMESENQTDTSSFNKLSNNWTLWAHLPHNTDWSPTSYISIFTYDKIEETIAITETLPSILIENCMLFMMKKGINPTWEDPKNRNGGCFSYKVSNKNVAKTWSELTYRIVGGTISMKSDFVKCVTGITISPKKNFCIIKIWMTNCNNQDPKDVYQIKFLQPQGCLFKKHTPEY
jgi:hypothetical protein